MTASTPPGSPGTSTADLLQAVSADLSALVRQAFARGQQELVDKAEQAGAGAGVLGASGGPRCRRGCSTAMLLRRALDKRLPPVTSTALTTALRGGRAWPVASVQQDVQAAAGTASTPPEGRP